MKSNILLVGMPGCGKSTIGPILAAFFGIGFLSLDQWIETNIGKPVEQVIREDGIEYFRNIEFKALTSIVNIRNHIIDLGSGSICSQKNFVKAKALGSLVWLDLSKKVLISRLSSNSKQLLKRPLLSHCSSIEDRSKRDMNLEKSLTHIFFEREKYYRRSDLVVNVSFSQPLDIVNKIGNLIG